MKSILALIKMDATNALRDSLIVYILIAPVLLSVGLRLFVPGFEQTKPPVVLLAPSEFYDSGEFSQVNETLAMRSVATRTELDGVVLRRDHTAGLVVTEMKAPNSTGSWSGKLVFQGNESREYRDMVTFLVALAMDPAAVPVTDSFLEKDDVGPSRLFGYAMVMLSMMGSLIGGLAVAFVMVEEKEQNVTRCFAASPVTRSTYYGARGMTSGILGIILALVGHGIAVGFGYRLGWYLAALVASVPMALMVALLVGGIARNQIQAVAVLKIVMALFLTIPLVSIFLGPGLQPLFYGFPNYWMFKILEAVYVSEPAVVGPGFLAEMGFGAMAALSFVMGSLGTGVLITIQGKELKPGWNR